MKRIYDPIHHFIELEDGEAALLDTAPLQRMRRLHQLGLAYLVFPAAEHTRFGHVLGAMAFGTRAIDELLRHSPEYFGGEADYRAQRRLLRAALLLHDVGHGPFSHSCEAVLGRNHESRTATIVTRPDVTTALENAGLDPAAVIALITGEKPGPYPVLREIVSGPNLDADRMDYLQRDAYFTGVGAGRYDGEQLVASLRVYNMDGHPMLGVDGRGVAALEGFVLARYLMFSSVYFHHTTRAFERTLHEALRQLWPRTDMLDEIDEYLQWDDLRVIDAFRSIDTPAARALRERQRLYSLVAEFNAQNDLSRFNAAAALLRKRFGDAIWEDTQEQLLHRLPLGAASSAPTVYVRTARGIVDAKEASDLIAKLGGTASWRKLYVRRGAADVTEARRLVRDL